MSELQEFLDTFVPRQEAADDALHGGNPEPWMQLWSHEDPVTVLGALRPNRLRVTHVYRRENGEWKIVHRHGDGLEADQAPSTLADEDGG
jgi:hypothetical protein